MDKELLLEGDCLLYYPSDILGWIIALKTWTRVSHVEVYAGSGNSFASRNGLGVNEYAYRSENLVAVLRPLELDFSKAKHYFKSVRGQEYDWKDILIFGLIVDRGSRNRQICSEFATNFFKAGDLKMSSNHWSAERTSPSLFLFSPAFKLIWKDDRKLTWL